MPSGLGRLTIHAIRGTYSTVRLALATSGVSLAPSGRMRTRLHAYGQPGLAARDGIALYDSFMASGARAFDSLRTSPIATGRPVARLVPFLCTCRRHSALLLVVLHRCCGCYHGSS